MTTQTTENKIHHLPCFKLKGSTVAITTLQLLDNDLTLLAEQIPQYVSKAPKFFDNTPVIIDCQLIADKPGFLDLTNLLLLLKRHHMIPIGMRGGRAEHQQLAMNVGLAIFPSSKAEEDRPLPRDAIQIQPVSEPAKIFNKTKIISQPIRSGQQVYAKGSDLIILGAVSAGAECLADGNIHIYGPLRGRALAGILGDSTAHIFCKHLEAELVSIAGHYQVSETLKEGVWASAADIFLADGNLQITSL